jgi:hypothetical protein
MTGSPACCRIAFATLSRAAANAVSARLRRMGIGASASNWAARAAVCERCPMRVIRAGVSYCGRPLLEQVQRDPAIDGCGCPTRQKARAPDEHCPLDSRHRPASRLSTGCNCKWCELAPQR